MLFDILNYSIPVAISAYIGFLVLFYLIFRQFITNLIDPLIFHILWLSSQATFFIIYAEKYNPSVFYFIFSLSLIGYIISLRIFIQYYAIQKNKQIKSKNHLATFKISQSRWRIIVIILLLLDLYSKKSFFQYAESCNSISDLFLYRFIDLQGRDPVERILSATNFFLYLFLFHGIRNRQNKYFIYSIIIVINVINIIAGGRSALIELILFTGTYIFYFSNGIHRKSIIKLNKLAILFVAIALFVAVIVSSYYEKETTIQSGFMIVFNRVFAAPDGIEYYLKYSGEDHIKTGIIPYLISVFGIYLKNIIGLSVKNIGWQLTELAVGSVDFAQGSNYTIMLQAVVFNYYIAPLYAAVIGWAVAKLRYINSAKESVIPYFYAMSSIAFVIATDLEYFVFLFLSVLIIYLVFIYPAIRIKK